MFDFCRFIALGVAAATLATATAQAQAAAPLYTLTKTIPLGGMMKWDYLHFDPGTDRVYISHATELTVLDAKTGAIVGHVSGLLGSHGIAIDPQTGLGYADSALNKSTMVFDLKTLKVVKTIPALLDADGMVFDQPSNQVFVVGGDANAVLAVDAKSNEPTKTIDLGGSPEFLVNDGAGAIYVDINDKDQIVKIDAKTDSVTARWPTGACVGPVGLAIDTATRRLFASCDNALMIVVDADSGKILASLPIGKGSDSAAFDPARKLAFSSNRDGTLSIVRENGPNDFAVLPAVKTAPGARTLAVDPATGWIYLVTGTVKSSGAPKYPGGSASYVFVPGTLKAMIFAPAS